MLHLGCVTISLHIDPHARLCARSVREKRQIKWLESPRDGVVRLHIDKTLEEQALCRSVCKYLVSYRSFPDGEWVKKRTNRRFLCLQSNFDCQEKVNP